MPISQSVEASHSELAVGQAQGGSAGSALAPYLAKPARHLKPNGSRRFLTAGARVVLGVVPGTVIWLSTHIHPDPALHNVALFIHLVSLVLGFGAVLVADYFIVLWLLRHLPFAEAIYGTTRLHVPIWTGLIGLMLSGLLLEPDLADWMTRTKLVLVIVLTFNGLQATIFGKRLAASTDALSTRLFTRGVVTTIISQVCWWGSVWIGFWNTNQNL